MSELDDIVEVRKPDGDSYNPLQYAKLADPVTPSEPVHIVDIFGNTVSVFEGTAEAPQKGDSSKRQSGSSMVISSTPSASLTSWSVGLANFGTHLVDRPFGMEISNLDMDEDGIPDQTNLSGAAINSFYNNAEVFNITPYNLPGRPSNPIYNASNSIDDIQAASSNLLPVPLPEELNVLSDNYVMFTGPAAVKASSAPASTDQQDENVSLYMPLVAAQ